MADKDKTTTLTISLPMSAKRALFTQAGKERRNPTQVVQMALALYYEAFARGEVS